MINPQLHRVHSKATVFLIELLINIIFFALLLCAALRFFVSAHTTTADTISLEHAVTWCENAANVYQSGDGGLDIFSEIYPEAIILDDQMILYLDSNFKVVSDNPSYQLVINLSPDEKGNLTQAKLRFIDSYSNNIYGINAYYYKGLTPDQGGGSND